MIKVSKILNIDNKFFQSYLMKTQTTVYYRVVELTKCDKCNKFHLVGIDDFPDLSEVNIAYDCDDKDMVEKIRNNAWKNIVDMPFFGDINLN